MLPGVSVLALVMSAQADDRQRREPIRRRMTEIVTFVDAHSARVRDRAGFESIVAAA